MCASVCTAQADTDATSTLTHTLLISGTTTKHNVGATAKVSCGDYSTKLLKNPAGTTYYTSDQTAICTDNGSDVGYWNSITNLGAYICEPGT